MKITISDLTHNELTQAVERANAELFNDELSLELAGGSDNYLIRSLDVAGKGWNIAQADVDHLASMVARRYTLRIRQSYDSSAVAALIRAIANIAGER